MEEPVNVAHQLRPATAADCGLVRAVHHAALRDVVTQVWGRDQAYQDKLFTDTFDAKNFQVILDLIDRATARSLPVTLTVLRPNRARALYERLGFVVTKEDEIRFWMRREFTHGADDPAFGAVRVSAKNR